MNTSGQEKEGTIKRDMAGHCGERPQYQRTGSPEQHQIEPDGEPLLSPLVTDGVERMSE